MGKIICFVAYESPWFPAGGIAAVMSHLPAAAQAASGVPTVVITPFHTGSRKIAALETEKIGAVDLPNAAGRVPITLRHFRAGVSWYFLDAGAPARPARPYFAGARHPYDVTAEVLLRDAIFFGAAAVRALPAIAKHAGAEESVEWNLVAQDWEAATALLSFTSQGWARGRLHLTLHNSYDAFATSADLARGGIDPACCPGDTIVHRALSVIERPAFTVSEQFASDFTDDLLQREIMAPHLQGKLREVRVVGVDNGPFKALAISPERLREARGGNIAPLKEWKAENRQEALAALDAHAATNEEPLWGDKRSFRRDDSTWFVMAGRDDPRQKGYDVAAAAVHEYLTVHQGKPECAQFLFFPIPGDEGLPGLQFLRALAERFPCDVLAFPFLWADGFTAALQGAAYGLMPSLYEPFGMANEFYLAGACVGIARATGGNLEQIVPLRAASACSRAVRGRAAVHHAASAEPTGILFRERDDIATALHDWRAINEGQYDRTGKSPSRVEQRRAYAVFREMASELTIAIEDGIRVYREEPELYYRMLVDGIAHIRRTFSWRRAGQEYARKIG